MRIYDALELVKAGQIIYIEDQKGSSWPFGVKNILNRELVACQALGRKITPIKTDSSKVITIIVPQENGAYMVQAVIEEADETSSRLILRPTGSVEHVQRRRYFRSSRPNVAVHYQIIGDQPNENPELPVDCMVWDMSGGGVGVVVKSPKPIYIGNEVKLVIILPNESPIEILGDIVRVVPKSIIRNENLIGVHFKRIHETDRDRIVRFITQEQLSLRKQKKK